MWLTGGVTSSKTEMVSTWKSCSCFCLHQTKPWFTLWSNVCALGICNLIFNHCSNGYKSKGRCSHLLWGSGWSRASQHPKKWITGCSTSVTPTGVSGKSSPLPTPHVPLYQTHVCAQILTHCSAQATAILGKGNPWGEKREQGTSCSGQHGAFCSMQFPAGKSYKFLKRSLIWHSHPKKQI